MAPGRFKRYLQARRRHVAAGVLVAGCAIGFILYLAAPAPQNDIADQTNQTKQYLREMETYGGKANVMASQIREWFDGLWQGKTLGITVAVLSALLAVVVFLALIPLPTTADPNHRGRPGDRDL